MNFDDALKHYLPRVWFRFRFFKYKYLKRGEREIWLIQHLVEPGTTAIDIGASFGFYAAERSEEHTSELQSRPHLVCRLLLEKKNTLRRCVRFATRSPSRFPPRLQASTVSMARPARLEWPADARAPLTLPLFVGGARRRGNRP